jgi:hypothetical protein
MAYMDALLRCAAPPRRCLLLFIGACEHEEFEFVEAIAKEFKNTGTVMATDREAFVNLPDDQLIAELLGASW